MNGFTLNEEELLSKYRQTKQLQIERLLNQYGTSLKEMRELYPKLTDAISQRRLTTTFPTEPLFFTASEATEMGLGLQEGWMLKLTPIEGNGGFTSSLITPQKWEITENDLYIAPSGAQYTRADMEALLGVPTGGMETTLPALTIEDLTEEGRTLYQEYQAGGGELGVKDWIDLRERQQLETEQVFGAVFPEQDIEEIAQYIEQDPEGFLADIREIGRSEDTEALLRMLMPEITEDEMYQIFGYVSPVEESKAKDIRDRIYMWGVSALHTAKQFFGSELPQKLLTQLTGGEIPIAGPMITTPTPEAWQAETPMSEWAQGVIENLQQNYERREGEFQEWYNSHPELWPREEWAGGVIETIRNDPSVLLDPAWVAYVAVDAAMFTGVFLGSALTVGAITRNPVLGAMAGVSATTPMISHDVYEDIINSGGTHEQATQLSLPIGMAISSVELLGGIPVLKAVAPALYGTLRRNATRQLTNLTLRNLTGKGLRTFSQIQIMETLEEVIQGAMQDATLKTIDENRSLVENIPETVVHTMIATLALGFLGGGTHTNYLYKHFGGQQKAKIQEIMNALTEAGVPQEQAELFAIGEVVQTPEGKEALQQAVQEVGELSEIKRKADNALSQIRANNPNLIVPAGNIGVRNPSTITDPLETEPEDLLSIPKNEEIQRGLLIPNWIRTVLKKTERIPGVGGVQRAALGWRSTLDLQNEATEAVVGRAALVYGSITRMGVNTAKVMVGTLRSILANPVSYFGFNQAGYSAKMAARLLPEYQGEGNAGTLEHVVTHPEMYDWTNMDNGLEYATRFNRIQRAIFSLLQKEGVAPNVVNEAWMHRVVTSRAVEGEVIEARGRPGRTGRAVGATPSYEKPRTFETMAEGIEASIQYEPNPEVSIGSYIEEAYKKVAGERVMADLQAFGVTPTERLLERFPEIAERAERTQKELADAARLHELVLRAKRGEKLTEQTLRAMQRRFPDLGRRLRALVKAGSATEQQLRQVLRQNERLINELKSQLARTKAVQPEAPKAEVTRAETADIEPHVEAKYGKLPGEESEAVARHTPLGLIEDGELTPEHIEQSLSKLSPEDARNEIEAIEATIGDQAGELIETYRYESWEDGETLERYLDSLLEVTQRHKEALGMAKLVDLSIEPLRGEPTRVTKPEPVVIPKEPEVGDVFRLWGAEERLAFRSAMERQLAEMDEMLGEQQRELEGREEYLSTDPVASHRAEITITTRKGTKRAKKVALTDVLKGGRMPETLTKRNAQILLMGRDLKPGAFDKAGRVRWEYIIDELADYFHMEEQELVNRIEHIADTKEDVRALRITIDAAEQRIEGMKRVLGILAEVQGNPEVAEAEVEEPAPEAAPVAEVVPQRTVEYRDAYNDKRKLSPQEAVERRSQLLEWINLTRMRLQRLRAKQKQQPDFESYDVYAEAMVSIDIRIEEQTAVLEMQERELSNLEDAMGKAGVSFEAGLAPEWLEAASELEAAGEKIAAQQRITETELKARVIEELRDTPEWKKLIRDYRAFEKRLRPGSFDEAAFNEWVNDPENLNNLLTAESSVMNRKSSTAKTLKRDTDAVIEVAGLTRKPQGRFRGEDSPDWDAYAAKLGYGQRGYDRTAYETYYTREEAALYQAAPVAMSLEQFKAILDRVANETETLYESVREQWRKWVKMREGALSKSEQAEIRSNRARLRDWLQVLKEVQENPEEYYPRLQTEFPNLYKLLYERAWELRIIPRALPKTLVAEAEEGYGAPEIPQEYATLVADMWKYESFDDWEKFYSKEYSDWHTARARAKILNKRFGLKLFDHTRVGVAGQVVVANYSLLNRAWEFSRRPLAPAGEAQIPTTKAGMPEAGLQVDMFGYQTPVQPKGKGEIVQISLDDYQRLVEHYEEQGQPMPYMRVKPKIEGISELSGDTEFQQEIFSTPEAMTQEQKKAEFERLAEEAKALMEARKAPYWQARAERAAKMEIVRQPGIGEGYLPMPFAGGRIFNQDFIDACNQFFGVEKGLPGLSFVSDAASILRMTKASLDFSAMAIQGSPSFGLAHTMLLINPRIGLKMMGAWYKALAYSTASFFVPSVFYRYQDANQDVTTQRISFGGSSRAIDYFDVLKSRRGLGKIAAWVFEKMPFSPYERAEISFYSAGEIVRNEFWKALSPKALKQGKGFELARHLDLLTGISDSQAAGVPLSMRQVESSFMWFAPNYTRACLSLVADVFRGGYTGAQAKRALGGVLGAGVAYYIGIQFAIAMLSDKDEDDAWEAVKEGLGIEEDPITGEVTWRPTGRFMTLKVGNYFFGIGGFWYGLVRLFGNISACINEVGERERIDLIRILDQGDINRDNPFVYWWYSRSSPIVGTGLELYNGRDFLGYPIEGAAGYAEYLMTRFEPIWMEQGINWMIPGAVRDYEIPEDEARAAVPIFEIFGWRTFPESSWVKFYDRVEDYIKQIPYDELDPKQIDAWQEGKLGWKELTRKQQQDLLRRYPDLAEMYEDALNDSRIRDSGVWKAYTERIDEERAIYYERIDEYTRRLLDGEIDTREYRDLCSEAGQNYGAIMEHMERDPAYAEIYEYFDDKEAEGVKYEFRWDLAYAEYNSQIRFADDPAMYLPNGDYNWDERDRRIAGFIDKWGVDLYNEIQDYINTEREEKGLNPVWVRKGQDSERLSREYWNLPYQPVYQMTEEDYDEGNIPAQYYPLWKQYQALADEDKEGFLELHPELSKDWRAEYRRKHPEEDAMLALWGYSGKIQSMEAYDYLRQWSKKLGIPMSQMGLGLPPQNLIEDYFGYNQVATEFSGNSAEAKLWRLEHPQFTEWAMEEWGWEGTEDYRPVEYYQLQVKWREKETEYNAIEGDIARQEFLDANPEYWSARLTMRAMDYEVPEDYIALYVEYYKMPAAGYDQERFLMEHEDYYNDVWLDVLGNQPKDFSNVPTLEEEKLLDYYDGLPTGTPRLQARCQDPDLDAALVRIRGLTPAYGTNRCS